MRTLPHITKVGLLLGSTAFLLAVIHACQQPYSPAAYRAQSETQQYAMICHDNKRTISVPAEEWKAHREHGDYRGPCRTRKIAGPKKVEEVKHTLTSYDKAKPRAEESYARWATEQALKNAYIDSLKAVHEAAQIKE